MRICCRAVSSELSALPQRDSLGDSEGLEGNFQFSEQTTQKSQEVHRIYQGPYKTLPPPSYMSSEDC